MNKNRLEAFSDGVIAIIITIMVLEMKIPHGADLHALLTLAPVFISYLMSFLFVGVYWGNHHHLMHVVKKVSSGIMLANLNLLFWLSLVPFATGWMGENNFEPFTVAVYAILLNLCGVSYTILQRMIAACHTFSHQMEEALKKQSQKGIWSLALYASAIPLAYVSTIVSVALFFAVAIMWLVPDKNIEHAFGGDD